MAWHPKHFFGEVRAHSLRNSVAKDDAENWTRVKAGPHQGICTLFSGHWEDFEGF